MFPGLIGLEICLGWASNGRKNRAVTLHRCREYTARLTEAGGEWCRISEPEGTRKETQGIVGRSFSLGQHRSDVHHHATISPIVEL